VAVVLMVLVIAIMSLW